MKARDPERMQEVCELILTKNEVDEALQRGLDFDEKDLKVFPGSIKGKTLEEDPEGFAHWFLENQPKNFYKDGKVNPTDLGVRYKFLKPREDASTTGTVAENHIILSKTDYFFHTDELYPE